MLICASTVLIDNNDTIVKTIKAVLESEKYISINRHDKFITFSQDRREGCNPSKDLTQRGLEIVELL